MRRERPNLFVGKLGLRSQSGSPRKAAGDALCRTAPFYRLCRSRVLRSFGFQTRRLKPAQHVIRSVLQPCIRLVKLAGCLASQLTELVAIGHLRKCPKNKVGTHRVSPSSSYAGTGSGPSSHPCCKGEPIQSGAAPKCCFHPLDARCNPKAQKLWCAARLGMDAILYRICSLRLGFPAPQWLFPALIETRASHKWTPRLGLDAGSSPWAHRTTCATCPHWMAMLRVNPTYWAVNSYFGGARKGFSGVA